MLFFKRYLWGGLMSCCFVAAVFACFSVTDTRFFVASVIAACGTLLAALYCFVYPPEPKPFRRVFRHGDWDFGDGTDFPILRIAAATHGMGKSPSVEFAQASLVFPYKVQGNGDVVIIRNNHSLGNFADMEVIVRRTAL